MLKVVSHTPIEVEHFEAAREAGGWVDVTRARPARGQALLLVVLPRARLARRRQGPPPRPRLGHRATSWAATHGSRILRDARGWDAPSDHVPVFATFDL